MLAARTCLFASSSTAAARRAAARARADGHDLIDLTAGEIGAHLADTIRDGAMGAIMNGDHRYTDTIGLPELRQAVAAKVSDETGMPWTDDEIAITAGAKQALFNTAMCLFDPGCQVVIPAPYWGTFAAQAKLAGAVPVHIDTRASGYVPEVSDIEQALTPLTRAIIINSPHNPTGTVYDDDTLCAIARLAIERDVWVIFDECYGSFTHDGCRHRSIVTLVPEVRERLVIVNGFSKSLALTGWRIGYLAAPLDVIAAVRALQSHTTSNPNVIAQRAILHHLQIGDRHFETDLSHRISQARTAGLGILSMLDCVPSPKASGGFYFYLDLSVFLHDRQREKPVYSVDNVADELLKKAGVAAVSGAAFGDPYGLRISYGGDADAVAEGCRRLVEFFNAKMSP